VNVASIVLIPWASTDWTAAGRLPAAAALPLNAEGEAEAARWGLELARRQISVVYCSPELTGQQTAGALARHCNIRVKEFAGLEEIAFGLWGGLTEMSLKTRFPRVFRRWTDDPTAVCPPEGESVEAACIRLSDALQRLLRKTNQSAAIVAGPYALGILQCLIQRKPLSNLHDLLAAQPVWYDDAGVGHVLVQGRVSAA
jgi:broad specificity phosphatase PhoE